MAGTPSGAPRPDARLAQLLAELEVERAASRQSRQQLRAAQDEAVSHLRALEELEEEGRGFDEAFAALKDENQALKGELAAVRDEARSTASAAQAADAVVAAAQQRADAAVEGRREYEAEMSGEIERMRAALSSRPTLDHVKMLEDRAAGAEAEVGRLTACLAASERREREAATHMGASELYGSSLLLLTRLLATNWQQRLQLCKKSLWTRSSRHRRHPVPGVMIGTRENSL